MEENETQQEEINTKKNVILIVLLFAVIIIGIIVNYYIDSKSAGRIEITDTEMILDIPKELEILSDDEIDELYGTEVSDSYEFVAMNYTGTKCIMGYIFDKTGLEEDINAEEYLEAIFSDLDEIEINEKEISGYNFVYIENDYIYEEETYTEEYLVNEQDDKFICLYVIYPKDDKINLEDVIS